ncbi:MAG: CRISPR system precrRNA processing endoribonuclease RAMP protein Cas6 [Anaerolineales bacterium]|nr:CRISPR system precrRNA processing endoribonuclease RAMP protein Cas6 [Anaerolineales bacterium]
MLTSLVIQLEALEEGKINGATGRAVHGFWYKQWQDADSKTAEALHDEKTQTPPFSLSPLMGLPRPQKGITGITRGVSAWFRVAALTGQLSERLITHWVAELPNEVELAGVKWRLDGVADYPDKHPWAGQISYQDLSAKHLFNNRPPSRWKFSFETPVTFNSGLGHLPFPLPNILVGSWLRRWQVFAPLALPEEISQSAREHLAVSQFDMKTLPVRHGERLIVGGAGNYTLKALKMSASERAQIDLLANYAFFCGSGYKTAQGMGLTRLR